MQNLLKLNLNKQQILVAVTLVFFMLLTRGSHVLTSVSLPDASLAIFLLGGLWLKRAGWFAGFFMLATVIDFGAAAFDPAQGFCLTNGYWGLIPAYGAMWLAGRWLSTQQDAFSALPYAIAGLVSTLLAFVISTQSYYLFSGRFPDAGIWEALQHGWEYLPSYIGFTAMYLAGVWVIKQLLSNFKVSAPTRQV